MGNTTDSYYPVSAFTQANAQGGNHWRLRVSMFIKEMEVYEGNKDIIKMYLQSEYTVRTPDIVFLGILICQKQGRTHGGSFSFITQ